MGVPANDLQSGASEVIVATDDERIAAVCRGFGARVELTSTEHASGTDRIAEVARRLEWDEQQIVVNVQGDEPLISPVCIAQTARLLGWHSQADDRDVDDAADVGGRVSRPEFRQGRDRQGWLGAVFQPRADSLAARWRHAGRACGTSVSTRIGPAACRAISAAPPCALEEIEKLEQLRALWLGHRIIVAKAAEPPAPAVDTEEDLAKVRRYLERSPRAVR